MALNFITIDNQTFIKWDELSAFGIKHCFTTSTNDMGVKTNQSNKNLIQNYNNAKAAANCKSDETFFAQQIHDKNIANITSLDSGKAFYLGRVLEGADGLITNISDITLITQYADCTPITLYDKKNKVLASVHSGWRGTSLKIIESAIKSMIVNYNSSPYDIHCFIWPSIGYADFEVDIDVAKIFKGAFTFADEVIYQKDEKYHIDLISIIKRTATINNIPKEQIYLSNISTFSDTRFHSYRRDKEHSGRMALIMEL